MADNNLRRRVRRVRAAARSAGMRLHYDNVGGTYTLHGPGDGARYGLTLAEAEQAVGR